MATRKRPKQRPRLSLHRAPIPRRLCHELLSLIGVSPDFQDHYIVPAAGDGFTVRTRDAALWVIHYYNEWVRHINNLRAQFEATGNWPPATIREGFIRMILAGLTNEEAYAVLDPIFGLSSMKSRTEIYACHYRQLLTRQGRLPPEYQSTVHPWRAGRRKRVTK